MKLAVFDYMVPGDSYTDKAKNLEKYNIDGMSVSADRMCFIRRYGGEISRLLEDTGVMPCELYLTGDGFGMHMGEDEQSRKQAVEVFVDTVRVCTQLGVPMTSIFFEFGKTIAAGDRKQAMPAGLKKQFTKIYNLVAKAAGVNTRVLLEPINSRESRYLTTTASCIDMIKGMAAENTGILADTYHMCIDEPDIPSAFSHCGSMLKHLHICEADRSLPRPGGIDWKACFTALKAIGYNGYIGLECETGPNDFDSLKESIAFLRATYEKA